MPKEHEPPRKDTATQHYRHPIQMFILDVFIFLFCSEILLKMYIFCSWCNCIWCTVVRSVYLLCLCAADYFMVTKKLLKILWSCLMNVLFLFIWSSIFFFFYTLWFWKYAYLIKIVLLICSSAHNYQNLNKLSSTFSTI